jgi:cell division protein FtsW (lipid II flippase)/cell division protein FtsI/penicillin-binding protein 2
MRVVAPEIEIADAPAAWNRPLNIELVGLAIATIVALSGIGLAYSAKLARLDEAASPGGVISLRALHSPVELEPALTMYDSAYERSAVARALFNRATAAPRLDHVGALADVKMSAAAVHADRRLVQLNAKPGDRADGSVAVLSRADIVTLKPRLSVRSSSEFTTRFARSVALFVLAFWVAHIVRRVRGRRDDPLLLPAVMLLCGLGLTTMTALRDPIRDAISASAFAGGVAAGVLLLVVVSEIDFEASPARRAVIAPLAAACGLATLLLVFGSGPGTSGVKVNLFGAQPVELIRLLVVFALAAYFGRRGERLRELSEPVAPRRMALRHVRLPRWRDLQPIVASMALVLAFFFLQKDLGPALVLSCVFLGMYGVARGRTGLVVAGFAVLLGGFAVAYYSGVPATVRQRVMIWIDPWNNGVAGGTHVAHGLWALATGGTWGNGAGLGSPSAIPEGHTDFVLAAVGEELGWAGLAAAIGLYVLVCWRCLRIAARAPGDFTAFIVLGVVLVLGVQALLIAGGLLGLVPLSGVATPFLSYGRSSMIANCAAIGIVLSVARRQGRERIHMRRPLAGIATVLAVAGAAIASRTAWVQVVHADDTAAAPALTEQADGGYRFEYNPRLLAAARTLTRGSIYDRSGLPLATSRPDEIAAASVSYANAGGVAPEECPAEGSRCYPLGAFAFHLVGDANHQTNWGARNSSYIERDSDGQLKGYDDHAQAIEVVEPRHGRRVQAVRRDLRALLPLVRDRYHTGSTAVAAINTRERDVRTTIDARLQVRVAAALRDGVTSARFHRGAAVVLDASTGELLAAASYPWPSGDLSQRHSAAADEDDDGAWLDRARYGLYPPGSTFKLLVAAAALRSGADRDRFVCQRLPDGRVGNYVRGASRPVRDDPMDTVPHGDVDLERGLIVSCNAYFAQLALAVGPRAVLEAASLFQISVARSATPDALRPTLAQVGYGQGEALVTPLKLARVSAAIAAGGAIVPVRWLAGDAADAAVPARLLSAHDADRLARAMRSVVTTGTGRSLRTNPVAIAGKTGTAEVSGAAAHAWFTGFAPYGGSGRRIAFAVIVEHAGYGGRAAAPIAGAIASAARELGLIQ